MRKSNGNIPIGFQIHGRGSEAMIEVQFLLINDKPVRCSVVDRKRLPLADTKIIRNIVLFLMSLFYF